MRKLQMARSFALVTLMASAAVAASSEKIPMQNGPRTPAATGTIEFMPDKAGNNKLVVSVEHVAQPRDIDPSLSTIAVWIEPGRGEAPVLIGMLPIDKNLKGRLQTVTPYSNFELLVTGEKTNQPRRPSDVMILRARVPEAGKPVPMQQQPGQGQGQMQHGQGQQGTQTPPPAESSQPREK